MNKPLLAATAALSLTTVLSPVAHAQSMSDYTITGRSLSIYTTLNNVQQISVPKRDELTQVYDNERVCENWVKTERRIGVDFQGYFRLYQKEYPYVKCFDFELRDTTTYPQAMLISQTTGPQLLNNHNINLMGSTAAACGASQETITQWAYQGRDLINGKPATEARNTLTPAQWYGNNYTRETEKAVLRVVSQGYVTLPTGERAPAQEYNFDIYRWYTMQPKGGGWGQIPLFRLFSGNKATTASTSPGYNPHSREYAAWFAQNKPNKTACSFVLVDLSKAPRFQEEKKTVSRRDWFPKGSAFR